MSDAGNAKSMKVPASLGARKSPPMATPWTRPG